jgi:CheY-like chemotaxis protein
MSHELRTPLNSIIGYSEMLQEEAQDAGASAPVPDLAKIHSAGRHLLEPINAVLDLSKIEAGKMELFLEPFEIPGLIREAPARDIMQRFLTRAGFRVVTAASGDEGLRLAHELSPEAITLDVLMPGMDGWAVLSALKDEPALADIPVVMATIVDEKNLGFALGAVEYLTKPIDRERLAAVLSRYRRDRPILVVDDDLALRDIVRRTLERDGWAILEAPDSRAALERLRESTPAAIMLDLMMPEMDGFEFAAALRAHDTWRTIPTFVVTAKDLSPEDRRRLCGSVQAILQKGACSREDLLAAVRDMVAASTARRGGG